MIDVMVDIDTTEPAEVRGDTSAVGYSPSWYFRSGYVEPRELGCRCDVCPLGRFRRNTGTWRPVPPEVWPDTQPTLSILAEAPGPSEVRLQRPQIGRGWDEVLRPALENVGVRRSDVVISNALLCQPVLNDIRPLLAEVKRHNDKVGAANPPGSAGELIPDPYDCCRPGVIAVVRRAPNVLVLGSSAWRSLTGERQGVGSIRGAFMDRYMIPETGVVWRPPGGIREGQEFPGLLHIRALATWNPAYVLRAPGWRPVFEQDVGRWMRWLRGGLQWTRPVLRDNPPAAELEALLFDVACPWISVDIETDAKEHESANVRCIGFTRVPEGDVAYVVHFRSVSGARGLGDEPWCTLPGQGFYSPEEARAIREMIRRYLMDSRRVKVGHNFGYFDTAVLLRELEIPTVHPVVDSILLARTAHSELPRNLYTVGTLCTDVPDWKVNHEEDRKIATHAESDTELAGYNAIDVAVVARSLPALVKAATERDQWGVLALDHSVQSICREMHQIGLRVDQRQRMAWEAEYQERVSDKTRAIRDIVGSSTYNPGSPQQLSRWLLGECKLPTLALTETGQPSTDDVVLREYIVKWHALHGGRGDAIRDCIQLHRALRTDAKRLSTVILPMRMYNDLRPTSEGKMVGGLCRADGRIHPHYNGHTPATGRISSADPNSQNFEKWLRAMVIPEDGHLFVGADYDQIELRLICGVAGVKDYIDVFDADGDPHGVTAKLIYGDAFLRAYLKSMCSTHRAEYERTGIIRKLGASCGCKKAAGYEPLRNFAKTFVYAIIYGGTAQTIFEAVASAENADGTLMFPDMKLSQVKAATDKWLAGAKEIPAYWERLLAYGEQHRYTREPIMGRVRGCPGGAKEHRNEILNFPIQGGAAIIVGKALCRLRTELPPDFRARTGIVNQMHDAITIEIPQEHAAEWESRIGEILTARESAAPGVVFSAAGQIARNWKEAA